MFSSIGEKSLEYLQFTLPTDQRGSRCWSRPVIDWFREYGDRAGECPGLTVGAMTPPESGRGHASPFLVVWRMSRG